MKPLLVVAGLLCAVASAVGAEGSFVDGLASAHGLGIPLEQATRIQAELGQLLVINVDGFGYSGPLALAPGFADLVRKLQVGGVIPHYGSTDYARIARTNRALAAMTDQPLLICGDIVKLRGAAGVASFGDGYVGGFLGRYRGLRDEELQTLAGLNAFVFAAIGMNVALGPTVDASTGEARVVERARLVIGQMDRFGIQPVLKHWPGLPPGANLHRESPDTRVPPAEVATRAQPFRELAGAAGIMMSTHFRDSLVDAAIVTFSPTWTGLLRSQTGFGGLLMTDGMLMLRNYRDQGMLAAGPGLPARETRGIDGTAVWAARAILAGHDMVILEGSVGQTTRAWEGLLRLACSGTPTGDRLAARIEESWKRVTDWKAARAALLRRSIQVPAATIQSIIRLLPGEKADLPSFRFDAQALEKIGPALKAMEAPPESVVRQGGG